MDNDLDWKELIKSNLKELAEYTVIEEELVTLLQIKGLINEEEKDLLLDLGTPNIYRAKNLYSVTTKKWSNSDFKEFKTILQKTSNSQPLQILTTAGVDDLLEKVPEGTQNKITLQKENLKAVSQTGNGAFGNVWLVKDRNEKGEQFAVKQIHLPKIAQQFPRFSLKRIKKEAKTLRDLKHENVVPYIDDWFGGPNSTLYEKNLDTKIILGEGQSSSAPLSEIPPDFFFIQMKYFPTCLEKFIASNASQNARSRMRPKLYDIFQQSLEGLQYVHRIGILHRDLKPANILMSETPVLHVVIGDFGLAIDEDSTMSVAGTWEYRAPELEYTQTHTEATDLFSLGLTFRECLEYFPDAFARHSVFETYKNRKGNLEDVLQRTFDSQALSELEWQLIYQVTSPFDDARKNATGTLEWIRHFLFCDKPNDIMWNEHTRGMFRVPNPIWIDVPLPVESFLGRQDQINELVNLWKNSSGIVHISGLSGMGISQLLYKFLNCIRGFSHCIFINALTIKSFQQSLLLISSSLGLDLPSSTPDESENIIKQLKILIEKLGPCLPSSIFVLHKFSNFKTELQEVTNYFLDYVSARIIIVTTDNNYRLNTSRYQTQFHVSPLTEKESVQLLRSLVENLPTSQDSDLHISKLTSLLGCIPRVLNSTAEYIITDPSSDPFKSILELYRKLKGSEEAIFKNFTTSTNWDNSLKQALDQWIEKSELKSNPQVAKKFAGSFFLVLAFIHPSTIYYRHFPNYMVHMVDLDYEVISRDVPKLVQCLIDHHICSYTDTKEESLNVNAAMQRYIRLRFNDSLSQYMTFVVEVLNGTVQIDETILDAALFWKRFVFPNRNLTRTYMESSVRLAGELFNLFCYSQMENHLNSIINYFIEYPPDSEMQAIYLTRTKVLYSIALTRCNKEDLVLNEIEGLTLNSVEVAFSNFVRSEMMSCHILTIESKIRIASIDGPITEEGITEDLHR